MARNSNKPAMNLSVFENLFAKSREAEDLRKAVAQAQSKRGGLIKVEGLQGSARAMAAHSLFSSMAKAKAADACMVAILNDHDEAAYFFQDFDKLSAQGPTAGKAVFFPATLTRKGSKYVADDDNAIMRTEALGRLAHGDRPLAIITYPEAIATKVPSANEVSERSMAITENSKIDIAEIEETLAAWGFKQVDYVYAPGEFAIRGSIIDIFSFSNSNPIRIDLFGDDVESIRTFDVSTQLSIEKQDRVIIAPKESDDSGSLVAIKELLPKGAVFMTGNLAIDAAKIEDYKQHIDEDAAAACIEGDSILSLPAAAAVVEFGMTQQTTSSAKRGSVIAFHTSPQPLFHKDFELVKNAFDDYIAKGYKVYVAADSDKQLERISAALEGIGAKDVFTPITGTLHSGFCSDDIKACLFTDHEIFDRYHRYNLKEYEARNGKNALTLKEINELQVGDYVVHIDHGIGQFMGLVHTGEGNSRQEAIKLVYAGGDIVMVSINSLHKLSKYRGKEGGAPKVSHLGTGAWQRIKDRAKKRIKDIARDLIRLYAARKSEKGFAFSHDNYMQHELEASFVYEDTPDQQKASQEVKADMEKSRPMDRLVCGDVGFGKTEVAIRAAFKAACDNKQTAVLVPTTVLAYQHFKTFSERLKDFPVRVDYLSRARTAKQTKEVLADLANGKIDIIVGTHKLTGKSVKFHDLGLLVIDEEQKFGVSVKEKLRQIKTEVDTLTLTATPIPRTLQFSLMGARDLSVIRTAPPNRYPIETEVTTFNEDIISEAINRELARGGQVFFVCNRVSRLPAIRDMIKRIVPEARVAIGHGQMPPEEMERVVMGFVNFDYDVLVSTTIVENGIDIPNANTIIIDGAQNFGLSDLHQMRGRVGRSNKKAYCYLLAPPLQNLPDDSRRRLEAIEGFADLGSGFSIALQDLDIRGAGNLLGAEQSGFIADLGYETYQRVLNEAVNELKTQEFSSLYKEEIEQSQEGEGSFFVEDCSVETDIPMFYPETYVPGPSERIMLYRELDAITNDTELERYRKRLTDRFGPPPRQAVALMLMPALRRKARAVGVEKVFIKNKVMTLYFVADKTSPFYKSETFGRVINYAMSHIHRCKLDESNGKRRMTVANVPTPEAAIAALDDIAQGGATNSEKH